MVERSQELDRSYRLNSNQLAETIAIRAEEVNSTLKSRGESLIVDLDLRGSGKVANKLQETGSHIAETLISRSTAMTDQVRESAEHVARVISTRNDAVKEMLATRLAALRGDVQSHRRGARRTDSARDILDARQSDHPASRRIRSHGEDLRLRARRTARRATQGDGVRVDAHLVDSFDNPRHREGE